MSSKIIKHSFMIGLTVGLVGISPTVIAETKASSNSDLDNYILDLDYDNTDILTQNGEIIDNPAPTESLLNNGKFTVISREKKQLSNATTDISVVNANNNKIFPGALLRADSGLIDNNPTLISSKRAPLTLSVDLPGMTEGSNQILVKNPINSQVQSGLNNVLHTWNTQYATDYPNVPAQIQYSDTMAYSLAQLKTKFGVSIEKLAVPLGLDFSSVNSGEQQVEVVNFKQIYYTVSMDAPENPADVFDTSVTPSDLTTKGVNNDAPPAYVSSVAYGRSMYIKLETNSQSTEVKNAFNAAIKGVDISENTEYQDILNNSSFTAVILGGDSGQATKVISGKIDDLKEIIQEGSHYNKLNPAVPISYSTSFLKDNAQATIQNQTDYVETKATSYNSGAINLDHSGAYVARYYINWDELSYGEDGEQILTPRSWEKNGQGMTAHFGTTINLPGNARNISIKEQDCTGLAWEWWRTIYDKSDLPLVKERTISSWGTTLNPKISDDVSQ